MSAIFISHSSTDNAMASEVKARLTVQGHRSIFLDFDPERGIPAGRDWERELYARLRSCQAVVVLCSVHSMASRWCFAEIAFSRSLGKALIPIKIGDCAVPSVFSDVQLIDLRADPEQGYQRLWRGLRQAGLDPAGMFDWDGGRPPYPGLMVFQEQDAAVYFGRGAKIQATVEKLNRMQRLGGAQLAVVLGASGSGKSSLLRAGVFPRLKRDRDRWLVPGPFRPLGQPIDRLATVLSAAFKSCGSDRPWQEIRDRISQSATDTAVLCLIELANDLRVASGQREATLLLGVDQFEELLAPGERDVEDCFLKLLRTLMEARSASIMVIGTLRSDFLGAFQNHPALRGLAYEPIDLPQLPLEVFAEVIEGPARLAGLELEPGLAGAIVADAATDDALPLLAFAMRELWEARGADGLLTLDQYRNGLGGLQGSVATAADGIYPQTFRSLQEERDLRNSFLAMVRVDAAGGYVRKPARWNELPVSAHAMLERFVQARLLVSRGEGTDRILEVAHEALIRRWHKLRKWVDEDREFLRTRERIEDAATRWLEAHREPSLLLPRGRPLAEAQEILRKRRSDLAPEIIEFIEASSAAKRAQDEAEQERIEKQRRAARFAFRAVLVAILGTVLISLVSMIYLAPGGIVAATEKYVSSIYYTPRAISSLEDVPLSDQQRSKLKNQIDHLTSRLRSVYNNRSGNGFMNAWATSQVALALNDDSILASKELSDSLLETRNIGTGAWKDVPSRSFIHIPATCWSLLALRKSNFDATKSLTFLIEAQSDVDGAWSVFPSGEKTNASTYATAWVVLTLDAWSTDKRLSTELRREIDDAKKKGLSWILEHSSTQSSLWLDYPENITEGSPSISLSSLVIHVLHRVNRELHADDLTRLSAAYLDNLPHYLLTPWTKEVPGIVLIVAPGAEPEPDTTRYYVLPWVLVATVDAYRYGGFRERIEALRLVDEIIANLGQFATALSAEERPWIAAEYLIALRYLAGDRLL